MIPFIYFTNLCNLSGSLGFLLLARGENSIAPLRPPEKPEVSEFSLIGFCCCKKLFSLVSSQRRRHQLLVCSNGMMES